MRIKVIALAASAVLLASPVVGNADGHYQSQLLQALKAMEQGNCPTSLLTAMTAAACQNQIGAIKAKLQSLGQPKAANYVGDQQMPGGTAEVYNVSFDNGAMVWAVNVDGSGKFAVFWTPST